MRKSILEVMCGLLKIKDAENKNDEKSFSNLLEHLKLQPSNQEDYKFLLETFTRCKSYSRLGLVEKSNYEWKIMMDYIDEIYLSAHFNQLINDVRGHISKKTKERLYLKFKEVDDYSYKENLVMAKRQWNSLMAEIKNLDNSFEIIHLREDGSFPDYKHNILIS